MTRCEHQRSVYLGSERFTGFQHVKKFGVVDFEQHTSDFTSQVRLHLLDQREQTFTEHLLLLLWCGIGKGSWRQRFLSGNDNGITESRRILNSRERMCKWSSLVSSDPYVRWHVACCTSEGCGWLSLSTDLRADTITSHHLTGCGCHACGHAHAWSRSHTSHRGRSLSSDHRLWHLHTEHLSTWTDP